MWPVRSVVLLNSASRPRRGLGCLHIKRRLWRVATAGLFSFFLSLVFLKFSTLLQCLIPHSLNASRLRRSCWCEISTAASSLTALRFVLFWITLLHFLPLDNPLVLSGTAPPAFFLSEIFSTFQLQSIIMAAKEIQSNDGVPQHPKVKTSKTHSIRSQSATTSPATGSEDSPKLEWHVCPNCKSVRGVHQLKTDEKSSTTTSPTTSDISPSRSISFSRLGLKIKKDLCGVFGHSQEAPPSKTTTTTTTTPDKAKVSKPKKKKKPQKKIHIYDKGYEELGGDHWADEY
jgi:hypothetical protein